MAEGLDLETGLPRSDFGVVGVDEVWDVEDVDEVWDVEDVDEVGDVEDVDEVVEMEDEDEIVDEVVDVELITTTKEHRIQDSGLDKKYEYDTTNTSTECAMH